MRTALRNVMVGFKDEQLLYQRVLLILEVLIFIIGFFLKKVLLVASLIIMLMSTILLFGTKEFLPFEKSKKQYIAYVWTITFGCGEVIHSIFRMMPNPLEGIFDIASVLGGLCFIVLLLTIPIKKIPTKKDLDGNQKLENFLTKSIYDKDGLHYGDTVAGVIQETGEPNIVPYKDRFLHFLILGPTGCGKTSQSLTPMLARDVTYEDLGIIVLEPKGDFAEQAYALAKLAGRKNVVYFNPTLAGCPYFNPLKGELNDVTESVITAFGAMDDDSKQYFKNMNSSLMRNGIMVVKTVYGDDATLIHLNTLLNDHRAGKQMIKEFQQKPTKTTSESDQVKEVADWFLNDYFQGMDGKSRGMTKTYENTSGVRTQLANLISNGYLRRVLNPPKTSTLKPDEYIDFERTLENGDVLVMASAQGALRDLGKILGMFLIQSFEAAVFRRPGNENTRKGCIFYVDEFQKYANKGYDDLLTQGRSYRVSSVLATQSRSGIAINSGALGKVLTDLVSTNCRNKIIYPGCSFEDARYYSLEFGEKEVEIESTTINRGRGLFNRIDIADQRESYKKDTKLVPHFSPSEIIYKPFKSAVSSVVVNNTLQPPRTIQLDFLNQELQAKVRDIIATDITPRMTKDYADSLNWEVTEGEITDTIAVDEDGKAVSDGYNRVPTPLDGMIEEKPFVVDNSVQSIIDDVM